jgi:hypothetical protein
VDAGIERDRIYLGNVFRDRPLNNEIDHFFVRKTEYNKLGLTSEHPAFGSHGFVHPTMEQDVDRLLRDLKELQPNVIIAMGATALWAVTGEDKIGKYRGAVMPSRLEGIKVVPTYHPAAVMRQWNFLPTVVMDMKKAVREAAFPEIRYEQRRIHIPESLMDLNTFAREHINGLEGVLSVDLETMWKVGHQITCVGMAPDSHNALVVPLWDHTRPQIRYWSEEEEFHVWLWLKDLMENKTIAKLFHNTAYDAQVFDHFGIKVRGRVEDTMLMHHALQPELQKSLGYLGSLYTDDSAWKNMVNFAHTGDKKDA